MKAYDEQGRSSSMKRTGAKPNKLSSEQKQQILDWVDLDCTITLKAICRKVMVDFQLNVSPMTISRLLSEFHYTIKQTTMIPETRNTERTIDLRYNYAMKMIEYLPHRTKWYFIDEVGFNFTTRSKLGRSPSGMRANLTVPKIRSKNYSCAAVFEIMGMLMFSVQNIPYNTISYRSFIVELNLKLNENNIENAILIADNVKFHHNVETLNLIRAHGHIMEFVAPYSPFMNPIEELFSQWKRNVISRKPIDEETLQVAINGAASEITQNQCENYVRHMESYILSCIRREIIEN